MEEFLKIIINRLPVPPATIKWRPLLFSFNSIPLPNGPSILKLISWVSWINFENPFYVLVYFLITKPKYFEDY